MNKSLVIVISGVIALSISTASIAAKKRDDSGSAVVKTKPVAEKTKGIISVVSKKRPKDQTRTAENKRLERESQAEGEKRATQRQNLIEQNKSENKKRPEDQVKAAEKKRLEQEMQAEGEKRAAEREKLIQKKKISDARQLALKTRGKPQEINEAERVFIKNLKEEDKRSWSANGKEYRTIKSKGCEDRQISSIEGSMFVCKGGQWFGPIGRASLVVGTVAKLKLDEKRRGDIRSSVEREWAKTRQKIAQMPNEELALMRTINAKRRAERGDEEGRRGFIFEKGKPVYKNLNNLPNSPNNLRQKRALRDANTLKNLKYTDEAEAQRILSKYMEKVSVIEAEYRAKYDAQHAVYISDPVQKDILDKYQDAIQQYTDINHILLAMAEDSDDEQLKGLYDDFEKAKTVADQLYDLAKQTADEEEDLDKGAELLETANAAYIDALSDAQSQYETGLENAEVTNKAFIVDANSTFYSEISSIFSGTGASALEATSPIWSGMGVDALETIAEKNTNIIEGLETALEQLLLAAAQVRDEELAGIIVM